MNIQELKQNFDMMEEGEDKFAYIIELGKQLPSYPSDLKTEEHRIYGCSSNVWFNAKRENERYNFAFDSDAIIVKGLLFIVKVIFDNKTIDEIKSTDAVQIFDDLGLKSILSSQRQVGLLSIIDRIKNLN